MARSLHANPPFKLVLAVLACHAGNMPVLSAAGDKCRRKLWRFQDAHTAEARGMDCRTTASTEQTTARMGQVGAVVERPDQGTADVVQYTTTIPINIKLLQICTEPTNPRKRAIRQLACYLLVGWCKQYLKVVAKQHTRVREGRGASRWSTRRTRHAPQRKRVWHPRVHPGAGGATKERHGARGACQAGRGASSVCRGPTGAVCSCLRRQVGAGHCRHSELGAALLVEAAAVRTLARRQAQRSPDARPRLARGACLMLRRRASAGSSRCA